MKKRRRVSGILLLLAMIFLLSVPAAAAGGPSKAALNAYAAKLKTYGSNYNFALIYFDNNSTPELVVSYNFGMHISMPDLYTYKNGKVVQIEGAGSDFGRLIYVPKKGVAVKDVWINGYGSITKYLKYTSKYKYKTLARFDTTYSSGKTVYKYNNKKVSEKTYNSKWKSYYKKYPGRTLNPSDMFKANTTNINKMVKNYKAFIKTGKKS